MSQPTTIIWYTGSKELKRTYPVKLVLPRSQEPHMRIASRSAGIEYDPQAFIYTDDPAPPLSLFQRVKHFVSETIGWAF